jgi:hypothetical protein
MAGNEKPRKYSPVHPHENPSNKPPFAKDRVERGLEADDTRPLYAADSTHDSQEQKFYLDGDGEQDLSDVRTPISEADEELRRRDVRTQSEEEEADAR